ncbi:MAG: UDP-N-acetylmuramate dehydrogenase [Candidatus Aminicenantes bacterium]
MREAVLLKDHSNFKIGGPADYFFEVRSVAELVKTVCLARQCSVPYYVIGAGCNLLFDDEGFRGLIIKNCCQGLKRLAGKDEIEILSGTPLPEVVSFCLEERLAGFEFLAGIPGTVGGAVFSNAGAFGEAVGDFLREALLLDEKGEEIKVNREHFAFNYRHSFLKQKHQLLLKAFFKLREGEKEEIKGKMEMNLERRRRNHPPPNTAYAGSYFKNPVLPSGEKVAAAYLLERVEARGLKRGGAAVYPYHSNFIINQGNASSRDVLGLAGELKKRVKQKYGLELKEEVMFLPANSSMP